MYLYLHLYAQTAVDQSHFHTYSCTKSIVIYIDKQNSIQRNRTYTVQTPLYSTEESTLLILIVSYNKVLH